MCLLSLAEQVDGCANTAREARGRTGAVIVQKDHRRGHARHVVVNRHDVEAVGPQRFQHRCDLRLEHRDVARDQGVRIRPDKRIGKNFDPSLGFVPRPAVYLYNVNVEHSPRVTRGPIQQMFFEFRPTLATDLSGRWESYRVFTAPINWRFRTEIASSST